jgi:antitoxin component YwqK of YwqJK toxin-antitoxin module
MNGELKTVSYYVNDKKEGKYKSYFENGDLKEVSYYINDIKQ